MDLIKPLIALLAIVNPVGVVPFFIHFTQGFSREQRLRTIRVASFTAFLVVAISALAGEHRGRARVAAGHHPGSRRNARERCRAAGWLRRPGGAAAVRRREGHRNARVRRRSGPTKDSDCGAVGRRHAVDRNEGLGCPDRRLGREPGGDRRRRPPGPEGRQSPRAAGRRPGCCEASSCVLPHWLPDGAAGSGDDVVPSCHRQRTAVHPFVAGAWLGHDPGRRRRHPVRPGRRSGAVQWFGGQCRIHARTRQARGAATACDVGGG